MTLPETLLPKLSEWRPAGDGRHSWSEAFPTAGWTVRISADKADSLSCLVWELSLTRSQEAPHGLTLAGWASAIASRATGLLESLRVYEVDQLQNEAVLRSVQPATKGDDLTYYEVRLNSLSDATLRRFVASKVESGRDQVAFPVTHETIAKLVGDIAG